MTDDTDDFAAARARAAADVGANDVLTAGARTLLSAADRSQWTYLWSWIGLPIIQAPEDILTLQEIIWASKPDLVIETGVARGGSLALYASLMTLLGGDGHVVGVDIEIRPHNRRAIEALPLANRITLVEGPSTDEGIVDEIAGIAAQHSRVMVVLDSDHRHDHVLAELRAYAPLVTTGQYLVVADTIVEEIPQQAHRPRPWGPGDNPATALNAFLQETEDFERDAFYNDRLLLTSNPGGYLRRR